MVSENDGGVAFGVEVEADEAFESIVRDAASDKPHHEQWKSSRKG